MTKKTQYANLSPELAEALARMDRAYEHAIEGLPSVDRDWEFVLLGLRSEVVEQVEAALEAEGLTRAELARRMGVSRAHISKILNEAGNFQLETIAKLAVALDRDIALRLIRKTEKVMVESAFIPAGGAERIKELLALPAAQPNPPYGSYRRETPFLEETPTAEIVEIKKAA